MNPVNKQGYSDSGQINPYKIKNGGTKNFYAGNIVRVSNGYLKPLEANTQTGVGVFQQAQWISPTTGQPQWGEYLPSGTSSQGGTLDGGLPASFGITAYVYDDPEQIYAIQAATSIPATAVGSYAQVSGTGGSAYSQRGSEKIVLGSGTSITNATLRVVGVPVFPYNAGFGVSVGNTSDGDNINQWGSGNGWVLVKIAKSTFGGQI